MSEIERSYDYHPISTGLIDREEEDKILNLSMLTGEHVLFVGSPGTAKSMQADRFFQQVADGGKYFKVSLSKFSTEEVLFGIPKLEKLKHGEYDYAYENTILDASWAFIDEIFDASDALLRSLLGVLNERHFSKGTFQRDCPLISTIATANYVRENEVTEAIMDRFLFQWAIKPMGNNKELFSFNDQRKFSVKYHLNEINEFHQLIKNIRFPETIRRIFLDLCEEFKFTSRRIFKAINVVKACAFMMRKSCVELENLIVLKYLVSATDEDKRKTAIARILEVTIVAKKIEEQYKIIKDAEAKWGAASGDDTDPEHLQSELKAITLLKEIIPANDEVEKRKNNYLQSWTQHYNNSVNIVMSRMGLYKL